MRIQRNAWKWYQRAPINMQQKIKRWGPYLWFGERVKESHQELGRINAKGSLPGYGEIPNL